jgi:acetyltransferase-like isoleucine patch superfamily enzyme
MDISDPAPKPAFEPNAKLAELGLRALSGLDTRGKHHRFLFEKPCQLNNATAYYYGCPTIGRYSYLRSGTVFDVSSIGRYTSIGPDVTLGDGEHPTNWLSTSPAQYLESAFNFFPPERSAMAARLIPRTARNNNGRTAHVVIGHDVWIGAKVIVRKGVRIGHGAIIGAGSFVNRDVAPYSIVAGLPARHLRYRFPKEIRERLLALRWWRFEINDLAGIPFDDIEVAMDLIAAREKSGQIQTQPYTFSAATIYTKGFYDYVPLAEERAFEAPDYTIADCPDFAAG